jgi:hypothetical protein
MTIPIRIVGFILLLGAKLTAAPYLEHGPILGHLGEIPPASESKPQARQPPQLSSASVTIFPTASAILGQEKLETLPIETTPDKPPFQIPFIPNNGASEVPYSPPVKEE